MGSLVSANAKTNIPAFQPEEDQHRRRIAEWSVQVMQGKLNNIGSVTLAPGATSTTVVDARVGINSFIGFMPTTANAASAGSSIYVATFGDGLFVVTHANSASVDKTFRYCVLG